jgi:hypothetical protein
MVPQSLRLRTLLLVLLVLLVLLALLLALPVVVLLLELLVLVLELELVVVLLLMLRLQKFSLCRRNILPLVLCVLQHCCRSLPMALTPQKHLQRHQLATKRGIPPVQ